jgi:hypothetical protein
MTNQGRVPKIQTIAAPNNATQTDTISTCLL